MLIIIKVYHHHMRFVQRCCTILFCILLSCGNELGIHDIDEDLDWREANVLDVEYDPQTGQFDVTLIHNDDGESGYADWWRIETLSGFVLGHREPAHAHGTQAFTRSAIIPVSDENQYVVVRGHDQTHLYGGQAVIFEMANMKKDKIDQGSEPMTFTNYPGIQ